MTTRVVLSARVPIGRVRVGEQTLAVYASDDWIRALRVIVDSVNAVEAGIAASEVINVPAGGIAAINVQDALNELDTDKASASAQGATAAALAAHTADTANPHAVTKAQVGLGSVDNTADSAKPVSTAQAAADAAVQAFAIQRGNHTGTQAASTISDFATATDLRVTFLGQGAPTTKAAAATLTISELLTGLIQYTGAAANLTMPAGTDIEVGLAPYGVAVDRAFDFGVVNTGAGTATILTAAGLTLVGAMGVAASTSGRFRVRKTAVNTYTVYRVA